MGHQDGRMTSTFIASPRPPAPLGVSGTRPLPGSEDQGPRSGNHRPRSRFPRAARNGADSAARRPSRVLWIGPSGPLQDLARDHAGVAGLELVVSDGSDPGAVAVAVADVSALTTPPVLGRDCPLIALTPEEDTGTEPWRLALGAGARSLLRVPAQSDELLIQLSELSRPVRQALVVGVTAGCGGAGASSCAARLAGAARSYGDVVLVDADPLGGGLDLLVEEPAAAGIRWEEVTDLGPADGAALRDALPVVDEVHLLAPGAAEGADAPVLHRVLTALGPLGGTVVVDLSPELVRTAADHLDALLVVVPATDHAVRATARRLHRWDLPSGVARAVVRRRGPLGTREIGEDLRLPVAGSFRDSAAGTVPLLDVRRGGADRMCRELLAALRTEVTS